MDEIKLLGENSRFSFSPKERMLERLSKSAFAATVTSWAHQEGENGAHPADILEALASGMASLHAAIAAQIISESKTTWEDLAKIIASDFHLTIDGMYETLFLQGKANEDQTNST